MRLTIEEIDHTLTVLAYAERLQAICPSQQIADAPHFQ